MKKQTKNTVFIITVLVVLIGSLIALSFLTKKQNEPSSDFITYDAYLQEQNQKASDKKKDAESTSYSVSDFNLEEQPLIGDADAPVSMILFSDFSCGHCKNFEKMMIPVIEKELLKTGKANLRIINYAFMNDSSYRAAVAAESVYRQNPEEYFTYYKAIYDMQSNLHNWANSKTLVDLAKKLKLAVDFEILKKDIDSYKELRAIYQDRAYGTAIGVTSTPTLVIEGVSVDPFNEEQLLKVVNSVIESKNQKNDTSSADEKETEKEKEGNDHE